MSYSMYLCTIIFLISWTQFDRWIDGYMLVYGQRSMVIYAQAAIDSHRQPQIAIDRHRSPQIAIDRQVDSHRQPYIDSHRQPQIAIDRQPQMAYEHQSMAIYLSIYLCFFLSMFLSIYGYLSMAIYLSSTVWMTGLSVAYTSVFYMHDCIG